MKLPSLVCIAVIVLSSTGAAAEPNASAPLGPTKAARQAAYERQVVCTYRTPIGSRIARKSCSTRAQADAEGANVKNEMRELARQADRNSGRSRY